MRAVDDTGERKRRRRDAQQSDGREHTRGNTGESAETRMPGHFSPTGESETVEALIVPEPQPPVRSSRLYPDLEAEMDEDDRQTVEAARRSQDKGKRKAQEVKPVVEEAAPKPVPRPTASSAPRPRTSGVNLAELLRQEKRKRTQRSSNLSASSEPPTKKARTTAKGDDRSASSKRSLKEPSTGSETAEASTSHASARRLPPPILDWIPPPAPYPWSNPEDDAREIALLREGAALIEQRRREGFPPGEELTA